MAGTVGKQGDERACDELTTAYGRDAAFDQHALFERHADELAGVLDARDFAWIAGRFDDHAQVEPARVGQLGAAVGVREHGFVENHLGIDRKHAHARELDRIVAIVHDLEAHRLAQRGKHELDAGALAFGNGEISAQRDAPLAARSPYRNGDLRG